MAEAKRKFYGIGDAKGFTKAMFFAAVEQMARGAEVDSKTARLVADAATYELEGIELKSESKATGEKKDPLDSPYAKSLSAAIVPFIDGTPKTAKELIELADKAGKKSAEGKSFSAPWVSRVLNKTVGVVATKKVVEKIDTKGLKSQAEVTAYKKA